MPQGIQALSSSFSLICPMFFLQIPWFFQSWNFILIFPWFSLSVGTLQYFQPDFSLHEILITIFDDFTDFPPKRKTCDINHSFTYKFLRVYYDQ